MAYGFREYPHTNYSDTDFAEIISLYKNLTEEYSGLLEQISSLGVRLTNYENTIESKLAEKAQNAVNTSKIELVNLINNRFSEISRELTSYETRILDRITSHERETRETISTQNENIEKKFNAEKESIKNTLNARFGLQNKEMQRFETEVNERIAEYISAINDTVDNLYLNITNEIEELRKNYTPEQLWNNVFSILGFSAEEWYNFNTTCCEWNKSAITCEEWYVKGKEKLKYYDTKNRILNPVTGDLEKPTDILVDFILRSMPQMITAGEYEKLCIPADTYDKQMLTAEQYDLGGELNVFKRNSKLGPSSVCTWRPPGLPHGDK